MANVNWDETVPADGDSLGQADDVFRSLKSSIRVGMADEHNWPAAGGADTGYHKLGSARPYYAPQSLVSSTGTDGRLLFTSDSSRLFGVGVAGSKNFIGGATAISLGTFPGTTPQRHHWVEEIGAEACPLTQAVTFPNSGFSGKPYVYLSAESEEFVVAPVVVSLSATGFTAVSTSRCTVHWRSLGTRVL